MGARREDVPCVEICIDRDLCTGCSACAAACPHSAITIIEDGRGFYRPQVDESRCVHCGLCQMVCPANHDGAKELRHEAIRVFAYQNSDEERAKSASGAAFWALAQYVLDREGVVYGACFDCDFRVIHKRCATVDEAQACRGSKYSQSFIGDVLAQVHEDLNQGLCVLYSGTPCQVAGLRSFLSKRHYSGCLITCDLICHGTPSNRLFRDYINFLEQKTGKKVIRYTHRPKDRGWGIHIEKVDMDDGSVLYGTIKSNIWRTLFYSNDALNSCCFRCPYTDVARVADFTVADFVGVNKVRSELNDNKGLSVVMANSPLAESIVAEGVFEPGSVDITLGEVIPGNPMLCRPSVPVHDIEDFWRAYERKGFEGAARFVGAYGFAKTAKTLVKRLLGREER